MGIFKDQIPHAKATPLRTVNKCVKSQDTRYTGIRYKTQWVSSVLVYSIYSVIRLNGYRKCTLVTVRGGFCMGIFKDPHAIPAHSDPV